MYITDNKGIVLGSAAGPPKRTLIESSYDRLRADIINGKLKPGSKLRIQELGKDYETGASPLREALNRLAGEGFVTTESQRGFRVSAISLDDLKDLTRMRIMLECEALSESIRSGDDDWEANIIAAFHLLTKADSIRLQNFPEWEKRNQEFHQSLVAACRSPWLLRLRHTLYEQHKRYRSLAIQARGDSRDLHAEHRAIKEATIARDIRAACKATEDHILSTMQIDEHVLMLHGD